MELDPSSDAFFGPPPSGRGPRPNLRFYTEPTELPGKSLEAGRPIYVEIDYVAITNPGSRDEYITKAEHKAKQDEFVAWAYKKWKATQEQVTDGTPLETVPFLNKAQIMELKALGIHSLENLTNLPDTAKQRFMGSVELSKKAKAYMNSAKDTALVTKLQSELDKRDRDMAAMKKQMEEVNARFEALSQKVG
jgi:signal transduction protein with GAF and PtsI domain